MSLSAIRAPFFSLLLKTTELNGTTRWSLQPATTPSRRCVIVGTSVRSKNRRPLQKGRNPSIEAIQTVQALKRANIKKDKRLLDQVWDSKLSRLLKLDLIAVLRELLRQNECELALKVHTLNHNFFHFYLQLLNPRKIYVMGIMIQYEGDPLKFSSLQTIFCELIQIASLD